MSKSCAGFFLFHCNVSISHTGGRKAGWSSQVEAGADPGPSSPPRWKDGVSWRSVPRCGKQEAGSGSATWARGPRRRSAVETVSGRARVRLRRPTEKNILKLAKRISGPARLLGSLGWRRPGAAGTERAASLSRTRPQTFSPLMSRASQISDRRGGLRRTASADSKHFG